jgi:phosphoribosylcarboxyaminoimidazole (NCAIR) mutase
VAVLALEDVALRGKLLAYREAQTERVLKERLETEGSEWSDRPSEK